MRLKKWAALFFIFILLLSATACLAGCGNSDMESSSEAPEESSEPDFEDAEYPVTVEGVTVQSRPSRVISLSPSLTEKLYDIGLAEYLVGVSDHCDYPIAAQNLPKCGSAQLPELEEIKNLRPHLVITQAKLPEEDLIALQQMNVDVVVIPIARTVEELKQSYVSLAMLLEGQFTGYEIGGDFARGIQERLDYLESYLVPYARDNGVKNALFLRLLDFNVATGDTLENELLAIIGLDNIAAGQTGWIYPADEAAGAGRAAFESVNVIYMDENFVNIKMLEQSSYYKGLQATLKDWYLYIDSIAFERQGLRMLDTLERMAEYAYPDAVPPLR